MKITYKDNNCGDNTDNAKINLKKGKKKKETSWKKSFK